MKNSNKMHTYLSIIGTVIAIEFLIFFIIFGYDLYKENKSKKQDLISEDIILRMQPDHSKIIDALIKK